jgi:hypothetical protein
MRRNFTPHSYTDERNNEQPYYLITEIGFSFFALGLLALITAYVLIWVKP